ncbi:uncharacterized protein LOC131934819 [Physella acuta]|uniref:uncharacterized protein LOC131934819 n=1 Tax=Physella acuta TaxID=109671 RepID=UPI0027DBCF70|nr:uncharacterized protein LOC131934819 [Physella acuta]
MDPKFLIAICGVLQLVLLADGGWRRIVVEENMEFLEFCSIPRGEKSIHWYMTIKDKTANVVTCTKQPLRATVCKQVTPIAYIDIEYGSVQNGTIWTTFLRVLRMPRELTQVKCVSTFGASLGNTYDINVVGNSCLLLM